MEQQGTDEVALPLLPFPSDLNYGTKHGFEAGTGGDLIYNGIIFGSRAVPFRSVVLFKPLEA